MTSSQHALPASASSSAAAPEAGGAGAGLAVNVLVFSDNAQVRDNVRVAIGRRPAPDVLIESWTECATAPAVIETIEAGLVDVAVLDAESQPLGGLGLTRQLHLELPAVPPIAVLTARPTDGWLGAWSQADAVLTRPIDPLRLAATVADLARAGAAGRVG